jgi:hypothetical protein
MNEHLNKNNKQLIDLMDLDKNEKNTNNIINQSSNNNIINNNTNITTAVNTEVNSQVVSKRILCELVKFETSEEENLRITEISSKFDHFTSVILNKSQNKYHFIQDFLCYIVEINSELIKVLPEYKDLTDNVNIRFIVPSKNLYNFALEIYFALYDLYNVTLILNSLNICR